MSQGDLASRRGLTFGQAEGVEALPIQMKKGELTKRTRAKLWELFLHLINLNTSEDKIRGIKTIGSDLKIIFIRYHVDIEGNFSDEYPTDYSDQIYKVKLIFQKAEYHIVFGFIQHVLEAHYFAKNLADEINEILSRDLSYYRVYDSDLIGPIVSDTEQETIHRALEVTRHARTDGPRSHIRNAIEALNTGDFASSVRESIGAVESISKILSSRPGADLSAALSTLDRTYRIHSAMKIGFTKLYNYTSDEKGIRHALLFEGKPNVDEADALFMIGACSAFVTYLITRANDAGITVSSPG